MSPRRDYSAVIPITSAADLNNWSAREWSDGVQVDELTPLDQVVIETRNSRYEVTILNPQDGEALVRGGRFFPEFTRAQIAGCSLGGSFLKVRGIYRGFSVELLRDGETIVTSTVRSVSVVPAEDTTH